MDLAIRHVEFLNLDMASRCFIISHGGSGRRVSTNAGKRHRDHINIRQGLLHVSFVSSPFKALLSTCLGAAEQLLDCTLIQVTNCVMSPDEARGSVALSYAKSGRGYNRGQNYRKITLMSESKEKPHSVADAGKHRKRNGTALCGRGAASLSSLGM